jgi:hypothetical protein
MSESFSYTRRKLFIYQRSKPKIHVKEQYWAQKAATRE